MVKQAVQDRIRYGWITQQLFPLPKINIGRNYGRPLLISPGNQLEHQVRCSAVQIQITNFVDDEEAVSGVLLKFGF